MKTILARHRWLLFFLWLAVSAWGIGLGAKLFELTVPISAWAGHHGHGIGEPVTVTSSWFV